MKATAEVIHCDSCQIYLRPQKALVVQQYFAKESDGDTATIDLLKMSYLITIFAFLFSAYPEGALVLEYNGLCSPSELFYLETQIHKFRQL